MAMSVAEVVPALKEARFTGEAVAFDASWGIRDQSSSLEMVTRYAAALGLRPAPHACNLVLLREEALEPEEYRLTIRATEVVVRAATGRGFQHALSTLRQLRDGDELPAGTVRDYPRLPMRGIQLMYESFRQLDATGTMQLLDSAAKLKLNTALLEFGDRFPFARFAPARAASALTREELRRLVAHAHDLGMETIPLQQSLGHLNYLLKHDAYAGLREEGQYRDQMCPRNEDSFRTFTELAEEVLDFFPGTRLFHIGADETRRLGVCPRCRPRAEAHGKASLYVEHINKVCAWLSARGHTPVIWDDILCAHPELMERLHESAWVMYWDYWTTQSPSPMIVARYNPKQLPGIIVHDARWDTEWRAELPTVTAEALRFFSHPTGMEERLEEEFLRVFGDYLGDARPKYVRAFPYLEFYQDRGRKVIGAPTCSGNTSDWLTLPDFPRYGHNIATVAQRCMEAKAEGVVTTAWYNRAPEVLYQGLLATAQFTW